MNKKVSAVLFNILSTTWLLGMEEHTNVKSAGQSVYLKAIVDSLNYGQIQDVCNDDTRNHFIITTGLSNDNQSYDLGIVDRSANLVGKLIGHTASIMRIELLPDDQDTLVSIGRDGQIIVWDLTNNQKLKTFQSGSPLINLLFLGTNVLVASGGDVSQYGVTSAELSIWDLNTGGRKKCSGHTTPVQRLIKPADGTWFASSARYSKQGDNNCGEVRTWDFQGNNLQVFPNSGGALAFCGSNAFGFLVQGDSLLYCYQTKNNQLTQQATYNPEQGQIYTMEFANFNDDRGLLLITGGEDYSVVISKQLANGSWEKVKTCSYHKFPVVKVKALEKEKLIISIDGLNTFQNALNAVVIWNSVGDQLTVLNTYNQLNTFVEYSSNKFAIVGSTDFLLAKMMPCDEKDENEQSKAQRMLINSYLTGRYTKTEKEIATSPVKTGLCNVQ